MKSNVLFISEKWCDGNPNLGFTHTMTDIFNTFSQTQDDCNFNTIHIDEANLVFGRHLNDILPQYCLSWNINIVIVSLLGNSPLNPSLECFQKLKSLGIFICFLWCDSNPHDLNIIENLRPITDLNVFMDASDVPNRIYESNDMTLWTPLDSNLFYPDVAQYHDVSFVGRLYDYRAAGMAEVIKKYPNAVVRSGQRDNRLTFEKYAEYIRQSKIVINFSYHPLGYHQVKGRVLEATASKCLLLESENKATAKLYRENYDYISFTTPEDLLNKVDYYLSHNMERITIAQHGYDTYKSKYNIQIFWDKIMNKAKKYLSNV